MLKLFRWTGHLEGTSLLLLLFVAMPLKYIWQAPGMVRVVGMAHGVLFIAYILFAMMYGQKKGWPIKTLLIAFVLSSVPFGTFIFDHKFLKADSAGR